MNREERWVRFACAALEANGDNECETIPDARARVSRAASVADFLEEMFDERFLSCPPRGAELNVMIDGELVGAVAVSEAGDGETFDAAIDDDDDGMVTFRRLGRGKTWFYA